MKRRFLILSLVAIGALAGYAAATALPGLDTEDKDPTPATITAAEVRVAPPVVEEPPVDHQLILDLVRQHRRTASDHWRQALADAVYRESLEAGADPLFVAAIVARESSFQSRVVSRAGAVGLMQIRPFVAEDVAQRNAYPWEGDTTLHSPEDNVRLGITYYQELIERFDGDEAIALTAYNRGPSVVSRELRGGEFQVNRYSREVIDLYERLRAERESKVDNS